MVDVKKCPKCLNDKFELYDYETVICLKCGALIDSDIWEIRPKHGAQSKLKCEGE